MPLGLLTLAAELEKRHTVVIYQPHKRLLNKTDYELVAKDILKLNPDIIGFSTWCISYPSSVLIADELKARAPNIPILFGGPQASILAEYSLSKFKSIDYILQGEADQTLPLLLEQLNKSKADYSIVQGLVYRQKNGTIKTNKINKPISDLNKLPVPAYEMIPKQKTIKLDVGRGCPFHCTYCSTNNFFSKKYRTKSANRIIREMLDIYRSIKIKSFSFAHDMFTLNKDFISELCTKLIDLRYEMGINFSWTCSARIDCVDKDLLKLMKEAGCNAIFFGIETGSSKIQKIIRKNLDVNKAYEVAGFCRENNIEMHASYIIGFPEETQEDIESTLNSIVKMAFNGARTQVSVLSLLPGTEVYQKHSEKLKFDGRFSNFSSNMISFEELNLIKAYPRIFSSFYYLPNDTLRREEITYLTNFINRQNLFRNTIFLIKEILKSNIEKISLLDSFKTEFQNIKTNYSKSTYVSNWIRLLKEIIFKTNEGQISPYTYDVFYYESYKALLLTLYTGWHILEPQTRSSHVPLENTIIKPLPTWKTIETTFLLEKILPSETNWDNNRNKPRIGNYNYLLVATSEVECKRYRISRKDLYLLTNLMKLSVANYVNNVKSIASEKEVNHWLRKMQRLGVIQIITKKCVKSRL
nr:radical SAM protein [Maribellus sediminis]